MRRAPLVLSATAAGLGAVLSYHAHPQASAVATTTTTTAASSGGKSVTGDAVSNQYGTVQVKVTVKAGKITGVSAVQLPQQDQKSVEISNYAAPELASEVLSAQSAQIDGVSGASYTSDSYESSLQSALDKLGYQQQS
jgi:uncharacterized protein with FMN-binding domain